jgi:diguanylate cyclase (GGDEF)-like protein
MKSYQIICIDDDEQFLASLERALPARVSTLCSQFQCVFDFVSSPQELLDVMAVRAKEDVTLAMVISDHIMQPTNGIKLIESLRQKQPELVCMLLTGYAELDWAKHAINNCLLDQYVSKPIEDMDAFASQVANLLKRFHSSLEERERTAQLKQAMEDLRLANEKTRSMQQAAEQVAMLSKKLKALDIDEIVDLVVHEVPKVFSAKWSTLCFPEVIEAGQGQQIQIARSNCPVTTGHPNHSPISAMPESTDDICVIKSTGDCQASQGAGPSLVIPLVVSTPMELSQGAAEAQTLRHGFLCMCGLALPASPAGDASGAQAQTIDDETIRIWEYKAALLREVLNANLTSALLYRQARQHGDIDMLTDVNVRRVLEEKLVEEQSRAMRYDRPFCLMMIDIDAFKKVNDTFGHVSGDLVLRELAAVLRQEKRATDVIARYGGDEFVMLMPETELHDALAVAERIKARSATVHTPDGSAVTFSWGLAQWAGPTDATADIFCRADAALYKAKGSGGNCIRATDLPVHV